MRLSGIVAYPLKGGRGVALDSARVEARGIENDRRWLAVHPDGTALTQRDVPALARVLSTPTSAGISLSAPGRATLDVSGITDERISVDVWRDAVDAVVVSPAADAWLSDFLGRPARLIKMDERSQRTRLLTGGGVGGPVGFADMTALLIATEASLDTLNDRLATPLPMNRFRPNLVIAGSEPFAEDDWLRLRIGDVEIDWVMPCARCIVTTIDQDAGRAGGSEPLLTLAAFRDTAPGAREPRGVYFGVRMSVRRVGRVTVGDPVEVLAVR